LKRFPISIIFVLLAVIEIPALADVTLISPNSASIALPADGKSSSLIQVKVTKADKAVPKVVVTPTFATYPPGLGAVAQSQQTTDDNGVATFTVTSGLKPSTGIASFSTSDAKLGCASLKVDFEVTKPVDKSPQALVISLFSFIITLWILSLIVERITELAKLGVRLIWDTFKGWMFISSEDATSDTSAPLTAYQALFSALSSNIGATIETFALLTGSVKELPRDRGDGRAGGPIAHSANQIGTQSPLIVGATGESGGQQASVGGAVVQNGDQSLPQDGATGQDIGDKLTREQSVLLRKIYLKNFRQQRANAYWVLECRVVATVVGFVLGQTLKIDGLQLLAPFLPAGYGQGHEQFGYVLVGIGSSMGSSVWHDALDKLMSWKAVPGTVSATTQEKKS